MLVFVLLWAGSQAHFFKYWIIVEANVTVAPGMSFHIPCRVYYPSFWRKTNQETGSANRTGMKDKLVMYSYWFQGSAIASKNKPVAAREGDVEVEATTRGRFEMIGDPLQNDCSLIIRNPRREDNGFYYYRITRGQNKFSYTWYPLHIHVSDTFMPPDIVMPAMLHSGLPSNLMCSVRWVTAWETSLVILWKTAAEAKLGIRSNTSSVLIFTPVLKDDGTNISCQVYFPENGLTVERTVRVNVSCNPRNPKYCQKVSESGSIIGVTEGTLIGITATILLGILLYFIYCMCAKDVKEHGEAEEEKASEAGTGPAPTASEVNVDPGQRPPLTPSTTDPEVESPKTQEEQDGILSIQDPEGDS